MRVVGALELRCMSGRNRGIPMATRVVPARFDYDGSGERWGTISVPSQSIRTPSQISDPSWDTTLGGYIFADGSSELLFLSVKLPQSWKEGSAVRPNVYWQKTTGDTGNVMWQLEYRWAPFGGAMDGSYTTVTQSSIVSPLQPDPNTANYGVMSSFGPIDATGKGILDMLVMRLSRLGDDAADTYAADCRFLEFNVDYIKDSRGSLAQFEKLNAMRYTVVD